METQDLADARIEAETKLLTAQARLLNAQSEELEQSQFSDWARNWAQPVTNKRWAAVCRVLDGLKRASGYRLFVRSSHIAWRRATGEVCTVCEPR